MADRLVSVDESFNLPQKTRDKLAASFANKGVEGRVTALEDRATLIEENTPLLEEQALSVVLGDVTTAKTHVVHVAPFPSSVDQVSFAFGSAVAASAVDYWSVVLHRYRGGVAEQLAYKTTREDSTGAPVAAFTDWNFDLVDFDGSLQKGDVLAVQFTPNGAPAPLNAATMTFRAPAADLAPPPEPPAEKFSTLVAWDSFNRTETVSGTNRLGTSDSGHVWFTEAGLPGIIGINDTGQADVAVGGESIASVDIGQTDMAVQARLVTFSATGTMGICVRTVDAQTFIGTAKNFYKPGNVMATIDPSPASGDTVRIEAEGNQYTLLIDRGTTGTWETVATITDDTPAILASTRAGIRNTGSGHQWDDFEVYV